MVINPYFKLRISTLGREHPASVVCEIKIKGFKPATPFATGVFCLPSDWNYTQKRINRIETKSRVDNKKLDDTFNDIERLAEQLISKGKKITPQILHEIYCEIPIKLPTFLELIEIGITQKISNEISEGSTKQYRSYQTIIKRYLTEQHKTNLDIESFTVDIWEHFKSTSNRSTYSKHLIFVFVKSILTIGLKKKYLTSHDLLIEDNPKGKRKKLLWLEEEHLERLQQHRYKYKQHENIRKAFVFQAFTGLAYEEVRTFNKLQNLKIIGGKETLYIYRKKGDTYFPVPLLKQAKQILTEIGNAFDIPSNHEYNLSLKFLGEVMEFEDIDKITSHLGRKTAGVYLLNNGVPIEAVSKILGHQSIQTTIDYYSTVLPKYVDSSTLHLQ